MGQNSCSPARNCSFHKWRRANTEWEFRFMWILLVCLPCIFAEDTPHPKYFFPGIKKWRQRQHAVLLRIGWRADPTGFAPFPLSLSFIYSFRLWPGMVANMQCLSGGWLLHPQNTMKHIWILCLKVWAVFTSCLFSTSFHSLFLVIWQHSRSKIDLVIS